jgi:hypothetical protein
MINIKESSFIRNSIHIFVLCGFVFSQPLMQIVGDNSEFLIAQRMDGIAVLQFVLILCFIVPVLVVFLEFVVLIINKALYRVLHSSLIFVLFCALVLLIFQNFAIAGYISVGIALAIGLCLSYCYHRFSISKVYMTYLSPAIVIFPLLFLFSPQVVQILFPETQEDVVVGEINSEIPVVMVVFDELPMTTLLSVNGEIDARNFPNFARLAKDSAWFRNANSVADNTLDAVPAILSGLEPEDLLPMISRYPRNLFTLLEDSHAQFVFEPLTMLCPDSVCQEHAAERSIKNRFLNQGEFFNFYYDLAIVYAHVILPDDLTLGLPDISNSWTSFRTTPFRSVISNLHDGTRAENFSKFVSSIEKRDSPTLNFIHVLLPHTKWEYLPSGKRYQSQTRIPGLSENVWQDNEWLVSQAYQRHLLQTKYVDTLVGNFLDKLQSQDLYDETMLIVTADHGVAFWPGYSRRLLSNTKDASDLMNVPLFVKFPKQNYSGVTDAEVKTTDILPTIAEVLGADINWDLDGTSVLSTLLATNESSNDSAQFQASQTLLKKHQLFNLSEPSSDFFNIGALDELVGKNTGEFELIEEAGVSYQLDRFAALQALNLSSPILPAMFTGSLISPATPLNDMNLAIVIDDTIVAVTKSYEYNNETLFSAMIRESQLHNGRNEVSIFEIHEGVDQYYLSRLESLLNESYTYVDGNAESERRIVSSTGKTVVLSDEHLRGRLDKIEIVDDELVIAGWALDTEHKVGAEYLLLDIEGQLFFATLVNIPRADVARSFELAASDAPGFSFNVSLDRFMNISGSDVRLFAVSSDGYASEVRSGSSLAEAIRGTQIN